MCDSFAVPVECVHLNQRTPSQREVSDGRTRCVLAEVDGDLVLVLSAEEINLCDGDVLLFEQALRASLDRLGIVIGTSGRTGMNNQGRDSSVP
jgi:hypothetical protein